MIEIVGPQRELEENRVRAAQAKPELRRHQTERRNRAADGEIHQVKRRAAKSRTQEAAASHEVSRGPVKRWRRANALAQLPDPPGFVLCWIGRHGQHRGDDSRMIAALQEGWEFARKGDFPEHYLPTQNLPSHGEIIGNDSTVLMKLPEEFKAQRDAFYNGRRDTATRAVNKKRPGLPEATDVMPLVEDRNDVRMGLTRYRKGGRPAADEA